MHDRILVLGVENFRQQVKFLESSDGLPDLTAAVEYPHNQGWRGVATDVTTLI